MKDWASIGLVLLIQTVGATSVIVQLRSSLATVKEELEKLREWREDYPKAEMIKDHETRIRSIETRLDNARIAKF